jgi:monoamine oxidase
MAAGPGSITRRGLLGAAAGGAALALATAEANGARRRRTARVDVAVVGAGLAGLTAARRIARAGQSVLVLEARKRVGGRTLNHSIGGGEVIEVGGQWVGPTQDHVLGLMRRLRIGSFETYNSGDNIYYRRGNPPETRRRRFAATGPLGAIPPDPDIGELAAALADIDATARTIPRHEPWRAPGGRALDSQTFETYKRAIASGEGARFLLDLGIEAVFGAEPRDVSLLYVLWYVACAGKPRSPGTFERLINTGGGAQERRVRGGSQRIALELARRLGRRVALDTPVRRIERRRGGVRVLSDRVDVEAERVIVAMAPAMTARLDFSPALPGERDQLVQRIPMGSVIKCQAIYARPFWRSDGLSGQALGDPDPVRITFDNSPPDGRPGVLLGFIEGEQARIWGRRPARERRTAVLRSFAAYFGGAALEPRAYVEKDWSDEAWTRGCYASYTAPGVLLDYGRALRKPVGRIHWAGTETATRWPGYMDGAVQSGERAAREALARLHRRRSPAAEAAVSEA